MRIGIPRALLYYRYFPLWRAFFQALGVEVVVSPPTTRATLEASVGYVVPETCLPVKVFCGQVRALIGQVDMLFVPAVYRLVPGTTNCAKQIGLPDVLRATMPDLPPLIAPDVDLSEGVRSLVRLALQIGGQLTRNPLRIKEATETAWLAFQEARVAMREGRLSPADFDRPQSIRNPSAPAGLAPPGQSSPLTVAVVGHPYNLYDPFVNHNLLTRLERLGVQVLTPERLGAEPRPPQTGAIGQDYWTFEYEMVGATQRAVARPEVNGVIAVVAFGCGPDSVMVNEVQENARQAGRSVMVLTLDEHSGEAGLVTRIEAFVDMLQRRQRGYGHLPGH